MGDAEIIPIGTRGRPGRGAGTQPSSAARSLAPGARRKPRAAEPEPVEPKAAAAETPDDAAPEAAAPEPAAPLLGAVGSPVAGPAAPEPAERPAVRTHDRGPYAHIPAAELLAALQGAARELFGEEWEIQLARFLAFLRRRLTGEYAVDEYGFDAEMTQQLFMTALRPIAQRWFRIDVRGVENIPTTGGALVVSNHSGTVPIDGLMTMVSIHDHTGRFLRPLGADLVFRMPVVSALARKGGATLACAEDAERMLSGGELVGVWPEGFKGIGKPYSQRYKLQRFGRGGFVSAALRTGVPIVPLSVVGAEEIYPLVGNIPSLARLLGVPYIPITPTFPLLGPLGLVPLPSKWLMEFGEPIRTDEYDAGAADDPMLVFNVTDQVRETIQQTLYSLLMQRESVFR
ncbi:acyltransferase family protein [Nocardioides sp. TRM66260-LWL]|uniref:lysophospholipid acyltransferase family protein n=1 Tax=Nocardioides sp. TRM66260-LWL TaxID=2874478 RepID=UPI001CC6F3E3|nr:lysophospholipid acyltransferase family protein [Nocardioides sp. TRM66260-LWL]MBZ5734787.1 acyltransferase family protein [Nocardioides sp. TRM66260-LWL]